METEATLDLLYKELDHSMLENENHQTDSSLIDAIEQNNEIKNQNILESVDEDDEVDTQVNADSPLLSSPFKMQQNDHSDANIQLGFDQPILKNVNVESFSGGTYINHSNKQESQMSPGSVKLINLLDQESTESDNKSNENSHVSMDEETNNNDSLNIDKRRQNTTIVTSFSLESTKPLLAHQNNKNNDSTTPYRLSMLSTNGDDELEDSPQIVRSPTKIPLTNTMNINQFANGSFSDSSDEQLENDENENLELATSKSNRDIPTTRFSSGSSYTNDKLDLFTTQIKDEFNLLSNNYSNINHKEFEKLKDNKEDVSKTTASGFDKLYKERMVSIATSIGDYQSAKENQTKSQLASEASESIADLSISTGVDLVDVAFNKPVEDEDSLSDLNQTETDSSGMIHSKTLENISEPNVTIQNENNDELSQISMASKESEMQESKNIDNDLQNTIQDAGKSTQNETDDIITTDESTNDMSDMSESTNIKTFDATSKEDSFSTKMIPNHLLVESLRMETSRESSQTLELDVDSMLAKKNRETVATEDLAEPADNETKLMTELNSEEQQSTTVTVHEMEADADLPQKDSKTQELEEKEVYSNDEITIERKDEQSMVLQTTPKSSDVRIPSIQRDSAMELEFIDDIFNSESDTSVASLEEGLLKRPDNYLAIWHIQEKKEPALNLKVKGFVSDKPKTQQLQKKPSKKLEKANYSFKPTIIHNPKINYLERYIPSKQDTTDITTSLSQEFENALKSITAEPPSRSASILRRPVNIWTKSESTSDIEKLQDAKKIVLQEAFGEDWSTGTFKTPGKTPIINKADSIKSFQVDDDDFDNNNISPATPIKEESVEFEQSPRGDGHVSSPFKIISKKSNYRSSESPVKLVSEQKPVIVAPVVEPKPLAEYPEEETLPLEENLTGGVLFMNLDSITVSLTGVTQHEAQFSLEIDNGINVTRTEWKSLNSDNMLLLGNELAIPIDGETQEKLFFTLKCKFRRPQKQLVEVVEKVRVGKSFGGLGKSKYVYEKRYAQRNIKHDEWDYLFAQDGSFARIEIKIDDLFLKKAQVYKNTASEEGMLNQWAKLITSNNKNENVMVNDLPRRSPYVAASFKYKSYYAKRSSSKEVFPSTLKNAIAMAQKYKKQQHIKKEDFLIQDGGDLDGMIEKRYFKLHGTELIGYHERSMKPKININLLNVKEITSTMEENGSTGKPVRNFTNLFLFGECFTLLFYNNESINFNSQSSDEVTREWYSILKEVIDLNVTHQPWIKKLAELL